jgi:N-acetylglucosamine-6-phosphate deacetylase
MPPMLARAPGPVAACLAAAATGELVLELIGDGVHLAPETVAMVFELVGPEQIALVTDAMAAAGMADGAYRLGALPVEVAGGVARLAGGQGSGTLAGGTARLVDVVRHTVAAGVPLADAVLAATGTPARLLGRPDVGRLVAGMRADVLVTDRDLNPTAVLRAGRWVRREES